MVEAYKVKFTSFLMIHGAPLDDKALNNPDREVTLLTSGPTVALGLRKGLFNTAPAKDNLIVEHEAVVMDHLVCRALSDESILIKVLQFFKNTFIEKRIIEDKLWHEVRNGEHIQLGVGLPMPGNAFEMVDFEVRVLGRTENI